MDQPLVKDGEKHMETTLLTVKNNWFKIERKLS